MKKETPNIKQITTIELDSVSKTLCLSVDREIDGVSQPTLHQVFNLELLPLSMAIGNICQLLTPKAQ